MSNRWTWRRYPAVDAVRFWAPDSVDISIVVFGEDAHEGARAIVVNADILQPHDHELPKNWVII